eukprot:TRINITY_DN19296_c0_g1_i1.p1 TRINITY_DN19296_c0_g1~~TRINITY_DN19296_c0_g1_i1.p1  ORF type:complete len:459 (+),score=80.13 TRINITY_DN19296_c0_g1_i1:51-1427(+)
MKGAFGTSPTCIFMTVVITSIFWLFAAEVGLLRTPAEAAPLAAAADSQSETAKLRGETSSLVVNPATATAQGTGGLQKELEKTKKLLSDATKTADALRKAGGSAGGSGSQQKISFGVAEGQYEAELRSKIQISKQVSRYLPERFPLPAILMRVDTSRGCIIGVVGCQQLVKQGPFPHDPHIRDIIASAMAPCMFRTSPCLALDVGASIGIMSLTMLSMNAHVISVEPQPDICASLMESIAANGFAHRSRVRCGGISTSGDVVQGRKWLSGFHPRGLYRYDGKVDAPFDENAYHLDMSKGVPLHNLAELMPEGEEVQFLKVDTDSIDYDVIYLQVMPKLKKGAWKIRNLCFETSSSGEWSDVLYELQKLGYKIYRTLLWQYQFGKDGGRPHSVVSTWERWWSSTQFADEVFELRYNRYLWRFHKMSLEQWRDAIRGKMWQYYATLDDLTSNEMIILERT